MVVTCFVFKGIYQIYMGSQEVINVSKENSTDPVLAPTICTSLLSSIHLSELLLLHPFNGLFPG